MKSARSSPDLASVNALTAGLLSVNCYTEYRQHLATALRFEKYIGRFPNRNRERRVQMEKKLTRERVARTLRIGAGAIAMALAVSACSPKVAQRGNMPAQFQLDQVKVGTSTMPQVRQALGSPSTIGTFDQQVWYYMSRSTEQWAFFEPTITQQQVLVLYFNDQSVLQNMQRYTEEDLREIALQERTTPTAGHSLGVLEQLLGNFNRFN